MTANATLPTFGRSLPLVFAAASVRLLVPLIVLPLMAVRVGSAEFGRLGFILVWGGLLSLMVECGFLASATRLVVLADAPQRRLIAQRVFTARCVMSLTVVPLAFAAVLWAQPGASPAPVAEAAGIAALACALGWPANWYLQGRHLLARWARVELVAYGLFIALCFVFAHSVVAYVALQWALSSVLAITGWCWLRLDVVDAADRPEPRMRLWAPAELMPGLRLGLTMLPVSLAGAAYSFALPASASHHLPKAELGAYFMADRWVRALLSAADPVFSVVYPRIVALFETGARAALRYAARWAVAGVLAGGLVLMTGALAWPHLAALAAERFANLDLPRLRTVLAVLGWLLPLLLGWKFIGYWMLGSGRFDNAYRHCAMAGGVVGVAGALFLVQGSGAVGLAWVAIAAEGVVIVTALIGIALTLGVGVRRRAR